MKDKLKSIPGNGLPYGLVFFGLSFMTGYVLHMDLKLYSTISLYIGISALVANGWIYNRFSKPERKLEEISVRVEQGELVLVQAPANHLIQESLIPGKLVLTDRRLMFKPYATEERNIQEYSWNLPCLKPVCFYSSIWNAGGEFLLESDSEDALMFEVNKLKMWRVALQIAQ